MRSKWIRLEYGDVLSDEDEPGMVNLAGALDECYSALDPAQWLPPSLNRERPSDTAPRTLGGRIRDRSARPRRSLRVSWPPVIAAAIVLLVLSAGVVLAASGVLNLGKPTNISSTNAYYPLGEFHRVPVNLHQGGKPELLFLGAQGDPSNAFQSIAMERWPLVKALEQFGQLTGVRAIQGRCSPYPGEDPPACAMPDLDLSHARYSSPYVALVSKDLIRVVGGRGQVYQRLSAGERAIFRRYAMPVKPVCLRRDANGNPILRNNRQVVKRCTAFPDIVWASIDNLFSDRTLPLVTVGGYLQTRSNVMNTRDFWHTLPYKGQSPPGVGAQYYETAYPIATIESALQAGKDPDGSTRLVEDVNAEANIITTLICHADGSRPRSVCGRAVIQRMLRHVK